MLPPGRAKLAMNPRPTGSEISVMTIGMDVVARFAAAIAAKCSNATIDVRLRLHEFSRELGESLQVSAGAAVDDLEVLAFLVAQAG